MAIMNTVISGGGTTPTGTKQITTNGTHDVAAYEYADVQVPTTAPELYRVFRINNGKIENSISTPFLPLPSTATDIGDYCLTYCYNNTPSSVLSGAIDLSSLTTISGNYACYCMFRVCTGLTSVDLSSVVTLSGTAACSNMFAQCSGITTVDLGNLTTISAQNACNNMFYGCAGLTSVNLSSLTTISGSYCCQNMFQYCANLTSIDLSALTAISDTSSCANMFQYCTSLASVDLSNLTSVGGTNVCNSMFSGCTSLINMDLSSITSMTGSGGFSYMFNGCSSLKSVNFNGLNNITAQFAGQAAFAPFKQCNVLESITFGGLKASTFSSRTNQFQYLFDSDTGRNAPNGCTVHFPSNFDPSDPDHTFDASTLTGYPTFNGNASYIHVAFDLPATES